MITLTTDFGMRDWYVGALKGSVYSVSPKSTVVDLGHDLPPRDVLHAAFVIGNAYHTFDGDAIHIVVVDPGVGGTRRPILFVTPQGKFIGPDNGILTYVISRLSGWNTSEDEGEFKSIFAVTLPSDCVAYQLNKPEYWNNPVSDTFHGRDIFAPVAAYLDVGVPPDRIGKPVDTLLAFNVLTSSFNQDEIQGQVVFIDGYGNLVTNVRASTIPWDCIGVGIRGFDIPGTYRTFVDGCGLIALVGSHGFLEIAETNGNAKNLISARIGDLVIVKRSK